MKILKDRRVQILWLAAVLLGLSWQVVETLPSEAIDDVYVSPWGRVSATQEVP
jgi:hypothetical protein